MNFGLQDHMGIFPGVSEFGYKGPIGSHLS